jgi:hypothetical protein
MAKAFANVSLLSIGLLAGSAACMVDSGFPSVKRIKTNGFDCFHLAESWYTFTLTCTATTETRIKSVTAILRRTTGGGGAHVVLAEEKFVLGAMILIPGEAIVLRGFSKPIPKGLLDTKPDGFRLDFDYQWDTSKGSTVNDEASFGYGMYY